MKVQASLLSLAIASALFVASAPADAAASLRDAAVARANALVNSNAAALRKAAGTGKEPTIVINADATSTHQSVVNVMEASRQAGYTHITFATQVKSGS